MPGASAFYPLNPPDPLDKRSANIKTIDVCQPAATQPPTPRHTCAPTQAWSMTHRDLNNKKKPAVISAVLAPGVGNPFVIDACMQYGRFG